MTPRSATQAALAAHRFGLGEARLDGVGADPRAWLADQIGPADAQRSHHGEALPSAAEGLRRFAEFVQQRRQRREAAASATMGGSAAVDGAISSEQQFAEHFRQMVQADTRARLSTAALTERPFLPKKGFEMD